MGSSQSAEATISTSVSTQIRVASETISRNSCRTLASQVNSIGDLTIGGDCDLLINQSNRIQTDCEFITVIQSDVAVDTINDIKSEIDAQMTQGGVSVSEDQAVNTSIENMVETGVTVTNFIEMSNDCINQVNQGNYIGSVSCAGSAAIFQTNDAVMECIFKNDSSQSSGVTTDNTVSSKTKLEMSQGAASGGSSLIILVILIVILTQ